MAGFHDKEETKRFARKLEDEARQIRLGYIDPQAEVRRLERSKPVEAHIADYEAALKAAGRTPGHVTYTIADLKKLVSFGDVQSASAINRPLVDRWVLHLLKTDSNKTVNRRIASVQAWLRRLSKTGGVGEYVLEGYPKLPTGDGHRRRQSRALTTEEVAKLLGETTPPDRRDLYVVALKTGLRHLEIRRMKFENFTDDSLYIPANIDKARKARHLPLHPDAAAVLNRRRTDRRPDDLVFQMPTKQHVIAHIQADAEAAGIGKKDIGFHTLRHTFCTLLARRGAHVETTHRLARHSTIETTMQYYIHVQRSDLTSALALL
jgi:integrase/recombinase XerC